MGQLKAELQISPLSGRQNSLFVNTPTIQTRQCLSGQMVLMLDNLVGNGEEQVIYYGSTTNDVRGVGW